MTNPRPPQTTAAAAYAAHAVDISRLLGLLRTSLDQHAAAAREVPADWSRAGDLGKVREDLITLVCFIGAADRGELATRLDVERLLGE